MLACTTTHCCCYCCCCCCWWIMMMTMCSAGVGRTGVFVTLSIVLERMRYEGVVDMFQTVKILRTQRPAMVQNEVQTCTLSLYLLTSNSIFTESLKNLLCYFKIGIVSVMTWSWRTQNIVRPLCQNITKYQIMSIHLYKYDKIVISQITLKTYRTTFLCIRHR